MVNRSYFYVTLNGGVDKLPLKHKMSRIIGVFMDDGLLHEIVTNEILYPYDKLAHHMIDLVYEKIEPIPDTEYKDIEDLIFSLTNEDVEEYKKEVFNLKVINSTNYFGLGDKMVKKMMLNKKSHK